MRQEFVSVTDLPIPIKSMCRGMNGLEVSFFPPKMSTDSLEPLGNINSAIVASTSPRLARWIAERVIGECERGKPDGNTETEPGNPVIDLHRWNNV